MNLHSELKKVEYLIIVRSAAAVVVVARKRVGNFIRAI